MRFTNEDKKFKEAYSKFLSVYEETTQHYSSFKNDIEEIEIVLNEEEIDFIETTLNKSKSAYENELYQTLYYLKDLEKTLDKYRLFKEASYIDIYSQKADETGYYQETPSLLGEYQGDTFKANISLNQGNLKISDLSEL